MTTIMADREMMTQKALSEWWSEETEYVLQRIERWAAFARGYNRLRSQRWSKDRQLTQERQNSFWNVDETICAPQFYRLEQSRQKSQPEETKINCCGTFNYQSNSKLDSNCLETYRYDHSIYFKTIGDIRSDRRDIRVIRNRDEDRVSISSEELVEWDANSLTNLLVDKPISEEANNNNPLANLNVPDAVNERDTKREQNAWPIVDLAKLDLNLTDTSHFPHQIEQSNRRRDEKQRVNNNMGDPEVKSADSKMYKAKEEQDDEAKCHERIRRFRSFRKTKRTSRNVRRAPIVGENNVVWPGVLLNYTNNFDIASNSPHD